MNYLAHLFLSGKSKDLMIGNFLGDILSLQETRKLPQNIHLGVQLHRAIDVFTDGHKKVREATKLLRKSQSKYAPVAFDILMDYLLYDNWSKFSDSSYQSFCKYSYSVIGSCEKFLPLRQKERVKSMLDHDWLSTYTSLEGISSTMKRMDLRSSFPSAFSRAVDEFKLDSQKFNKLFLSFFPEVIDFSEEFILQNAGSK